MITHHPLVPRYINCIVPNCSRIAAERHAICTPHLWAEAAILCAMAVLTMSGLFWMLSRIWE